MSDKPADIPLAPDGAIDCDLPCSSCGYNLRGLQPSGSCPECRASVARAVRGDLLQFADSTWLLTVRKGVGVELASIAMGILAGIIVVISGTLTAGASYATGIQMLGTLGQIAVSGIGLWGAILITTQEPRVSREEDPLALRRVVRTFAILAFFGEMLQLTGFTGSTIGIVLSVVGSLLGLASIVAYFGKMVYLRRMARRVPQEKLVRDTTIVLWGTGVLGFGALLGAMVFAIAVAADVRSSSPLSVLGVGLGCVWLVGLCVFALWYVRLLLQYRVVLATAAQPVEPLPEAVLQSPQQYRVS